MAGLVEFFRRGEVERDIRLLAAQGVLAPAAGEQIALLMLLVRDPDSAIAVTADATIAAIPRETLAGFLARPEATADMRAFFAERGVQAAAVSAPSADAPLIERAVDPERAEGADGEGGEGPALERIAKMTVPQRVALAMKGSREERAILIRDPNKIVSAAVISSPRITDAEVESIARMANVSDEILRMIAQKRAWMRNYAVVAALARNPKTPLAISMNLLPRLTDRDLRAVSTDRNVPDVLRVTARKKLVIS